MGRKYTNTCQSATRAVSYMTFVHHILLYVSQSVTLNKFHKVEPRRELSMHKDFRTILLNSE